MKYVLPVLASLMACSTPPSRSTGTGADLASTSDGGMLSLEYEDGGTPFDPDAACASAVETATVAFRPVDIIWVVDNSSSMSPAIAEVTSGLNDFAQLISSKSLDYKIIMLALRSKTNPVMLGGSNRYGICIPPPLAGGANCENGTRFFHSSIDIRSTQPLEQLLGTLGQTAGYQAGEEKGGEAWKNELRANATKTIVVVSDDNARFTAAQLDSFAGGKNPFNSLTLPPGLLDASWSGLFAGYTFDALYGWGSAVDPTQKCSYPGGTAPASSGPTYTDLVTKTSGVRAKICDGAPAWSTFFQSIATAVSQTSKLTCDLAIPTPKGGAIDPDAVNVAIVGATGGVTVGKVTSASACSPTAGGWYYDNDAAPTRVLLCPASCDHAQTQVSSGMGSIQIQFGCRTVIQ